MYRQAIEDLKSWKVKKNRKPLVIRGARQVGKTWLMKEFGQSEYDNMVYVNLDGNDTMRSLFAPVTETERIISGLEIYSDTGIIPGKTLIIFDEIQEIPQALASLKYFYENRPDLHIVCAGSLLGVALHEGTSFPVGKVDFYDLYPLSFFEFMIAMAKEKYIEMLQNKNFDLADAFSEEFTRQLKLYYFIGGMPEAVAGYREDRDLKKVRGIQKNILDAYEQDFSKHAPAQIVPRIRMVWNSLPSQLSRENNKFVYGVIKSGARAREYETAIMWLSDCGLVHKVSRVSKPGIPLEAYRDIKSFKLFMLDVGLLSCMTHLDEKVLLKGSEIFTEFKGALTEQYVLQQLKSLRRIPEIYYWSKAGGDAEIDFLVENGQNVIPVEVKAEKNLQAKSLKSYRESYKPDCSVRTSMSSYKREADLIDIPLWAVRMILEVCKR